MDDEGYVRCVYITSLTPLFQFCRSVSEDTLTFVPLNLEPSRRLFIFAFSVFLSHVMRLECILGNGNELVVSVKRQR
jgi:hypothetical protein